MATLPIPSSFGDSLISFSHDIYKEVDGTGNVCVSPYSIVSAMLMLMAGTRGTSKTQIKSAIVNNDLNDFFIYPQYKNLSDKVFSAQENTLHIATKLFVMKGLQVTRKVRRVAKTYFKANIGNLDFANPIRSARVMNRYVARRTNDKIKNLIKSRWLSSGTVMVLVNTLYFKGSWETPFNPKRTQKEDFFLTERNRMKVDMMETKANVRYYNGRSYEAISLPYKGKRYEMVIVLPRRLDGLNALKSSSLPNVANVIDSGFVNSKLLVKVPKFAFTSDTNLKELLPKLGITDIFQAGKADFSDLVSKGQKGLYVSEARHKVVIEVSEFGTEAAAATVIVITKSLPQKQFIANRPFLFYIRHVTTGSILFIGHYRGPQRKKTPEE